MVARLQLFGAPGLFAADGTRVALGGRALAFLAILAVDGRPVSRERLAQLLWADRGAPQARASLRQCLVELRRAFAALGVEPPLLADRRSLAIDPAGLDSDLAAVLAAADAEALIAALRACTPAALLDGVHFPGAFMAWLAEARQRIEDALTLGFEALVKGDIADPVAEQLARARLRHRPGCSISRAMLGAEPFAPAPATLQRFLPPLPLPADAPPAIAVLSFGHDPGDSVQAMTVLAIREEIVAALARFSEIRLVVHEGAAASFAPATDYTLGVTISRQGASHVLSARLSAADSSILWGNRFTVANNTLQTTINTVVERIVGAITPTVEMHLASERPDGGLFAHYLATRLRAQRPASFAAARQIADELESIIAQAPRFAPAYLPLARLYNTDFAWTRAMSSDTALHDRAYDLARTAVGLDRRNAHGYSVLGWCHLWRRDWGAARRFFDEAARLNPYHAVRLMEVAYGLLHLGAFDASETLLRQCITINPVVNDGFYFDLGMLALARGDPLQACDHLSMQIDPDPLGALATALARVQAGLEAGQARASAKAMLAPLWANGRLPSTPVVRDWMVARHPFRMAEHRERFLSGLDAVLA